ncbi:MAG: putative lipid II flippase FtsW [Acidobacteriota bacterium]|nr:MAG: putative lipid II flippase FtsW [Acidobacteriota bacterium]
MNRKMPYDQILVMVVLILVGIGLVLVFSASPVMSKEIYGTSAGIFARQLIAVLLGLLLLLLAMRTDYHRYANEWVVYGSFVLVIGLLAWVLINPDVNGASRWIHLGPARFQPSEAAKLVAVFMLSFLLTRKGGQIDRLDRQLITALGLIGVLILLVGIEPDLGTSISLLVTAGILLFIAGLNYRYYLLLLLASIPLYYFLVHQVPYRRARIEAFLDPQADPFDTGYHILQSLVAVGSGGLMGKGLAQGTQKLFFLPEPHTDFIYAVLGEEYGLLGCVTVLLLFAVFICRGIQISMRADSIFGTYLGLGVVTMIGFQALLNMSVVLGLCPTKGIPLPFLSVGGSSAVIMLMSVGILLNISRHSRGQLAARAKPAVPGKSTSQKLKWEER